MAETKIDASINVDFTVTMQMTVAEARALEEITKYGAKAFLEGYYKQLGKSYLQPYEKDVIKLFETIKEQLPQQVYKVDKLVEHINKIDHPNLKITSNYSAKRHP